MIGGGLLWAVNGLVLAYFVVLNAAYFAMSLMAFRALRRYSARLKSVDIQDFLASAGAPPVTLIVPAYNEEETVVDVVRALLTLNYPEYEIIVVNDGSEDSTVDRLKSAFDMGRAARMQVAEFETEPVRDVLRSRWHPNLWMIDKENGGKADALNSGLAYCQTPLLCVMDADTLLERDALFRIVRPFLEDQRTVAAGGVVRVVNGCVVESGQVVDVRLPKSLLARMQVLEYLRAFLAGRMGWDALNATLIISGAFGVFRRSVAVDVGGFRTDLVGEDVELVVRMHRHCRDLGTPYRIGFIPDPVAWTQAPETFVGLGRQRDRWQRGLSEAVTLHREMMFDPAYGRIGMIAMPHFFFLEMWGPVIEVIGYLAFALTLALGLASVPYVLAFFMVAIVLGVVLSVAAVGLEEITFRRYPRFRDLLSLFMLAIIENLGYRQIVTFWRVKGMVSFFATKQSWGTAVRKGFS
jgi:cellulose synthase/poly-beta-1,6-N-acetylglucosamine synthase-like glycosyltransferase